jgi:hypothetical protein
VVGQIANEFVHRAKDKLAHWKLVLNKSNISFNEIDKE